MKGAPTTRETEYRARVSAVEPEELPLEDDDLEAFEAPVPKALDTARRLGRYVLSHEIASGGMATVHLARSVGHAGFEKVFAIKSIHPHLAKDPAFVQMFMDEARVASRIDHPNVCRVFDFGQADGTHYIVMEYVVGETLAALHQRVFSQAAAADRVRLSVYAARIVAEVCEGLHAAHELKDESGAPLGLVHRDVTPHNLFVCFDGSVRLLDFGVAKTAGRAQHTKTGVLKGKVAYMPPEQLRRRPLDRRADLWSMGVVLWELVTGARLFKRDNDIETVLAIDQEPPRKVSEVTPTLPKELDTIVARALAREPADRYATAREMARELHRYVARSAEPVGVAEMGEWMESLFRATRDQRLKAVDEARATGSVEIEDVSELEAAAPARPPPPPGAKVLASAPTISSVTLAAEILAPPSPDAATATPPSTVPPSTAPEQPIDAEAPRRATSPPTFVLEHPRGESHAMVTSRVAAPRAAQADGEAASLGQRIFGTIAIGLGVLATAVGVGLIGLQLFGNNGPRVTLVPSTTSTPVSTSIPVASPPTPEPTTTPAVAGFVSVTTPGGRAEIYVDGERVGTSPMRVSLPVGRRTLELRPSGGRARVRRTVDVREGSVARLVVPIE